MRRFLVLDGPVGTELLARGFEADPVLWTARAALDAPELLRAIHTDYLRAGARMITANTFRATSYAAAKAGLTPRDAQKLAHASLAVATEAIEGFGAKEPVFMAGSLGPLEDCYQPGLTPQEEVLARVHQESARWLLEGGCEQILVETMPTRREAVAAAKAARKAGARGLLVSFVTEETGQKLLGGEPLLEAARACAAEGAAAILVNCVHADAVERALGALAPLRESGIALGAYANASRMRMNVVGRPEWEVDHRPVEEQAREYAERAAGWVTRFGVSIVGSCCGTTPLHIRELAKRA